MSKKKAISLLVVILALAMVLGILAVTPFQVGVMDYNPPLQNIPLGIELSGGVYVVFDVSVPEKDGVPLYPESELNENIKATIDRLQKRLLAAGYSEATVVESGANRLRVEVADVGTGTIDADEIFAIIGKPAVLEFRDPDGKVILSGQQGHIKSATAGLDKNVYGVYLELSNEGKELFATATAELIGKNIDIYLDNDLIQSATVQSAIKDGNPVISGSFTAETALALALQIQGGALTVDLTVTEQSNTSATLGENAITTSLLAGIIGLFLVFVFMAVAYKGLGLVADIALLIYTIIVVYLLGTLPIIQLSLAGIAGIVLSIGMAVDANIIIFERIKDEYALGKNIPSSVQAGFKRATAAIIDANITTIIASAVLYFLGTSTIKAFAITLFIGIVVSLFTSLVVTRVLANIFVSINKTNNKFYNLHSEVSIND